ncbi:glycerol-3-phosphate 1-O-acyltransferase PlsY [candidate division KSB1 bacterium]|nr:glycerol-3-phosphate 1-O-acyltransferase PlsY [candidate division KSB1 bacterium]
MISLLVILILSYLAGAFPTAILAGRLILKDDIRNHGSGNAGATNVFRVMGWEAALVVVLIDIGKGVLATLLISSLVIDTPLLSPPMMKMCAGFAAIIGHIWTVFAGFRGGKGVGTAFGVLVSLAPIPSLIALAVWLILVFTTKIVSVGSISAGISLPVSLILQRQFFKPELHIGLIIMGLILGLLIVVTHRPNIQRLIKGEENKFGSSKKKETA